MHPTTLGSFLTAAAFAANSNAVSLFVADSAGSLTTLALTESQKGFDLSVTSKSAECQASPSWLTLDKSSRVLYCLDRGGNTASSGSLNSFSIGEGGALKHIARVKAPASGVAGEIVSGANGRRGYFSAS
jgi:6-phosphogluconolactonase (cycloisomerase 2 family)